MVIKRDDEGQVEAAGPQQARRAKCAAENLHRHAHYTPRTGLSNLFFDGRSIRAGLNCALAPVRDGPCTGPTFKLKCPLSASEWRTLARWPAGGASYNRRHVHENLGGGSLSVGLCRPPHPGVELANNGAERPLRRAALWHRRSFGKRSEAGGRFVERILTSVAALHQQHRDVLDYLTDACAAANRHSRAPSLLPEGFCFCSSNVVNSKALGKVIPNS